MNDRQEKYLEWMKRRNDEYIYLEEAYKLVCAWLAFSALLNAVLLACWLMEVWQ